MSLWAVSKVSGFSDWHETVVLFFVVFVGVLVLFFFDFNISLIVAPVQGYALSWERVCPVNKHMDVQ